MAFKIKTPPIIVNYSASAGRFLSGRSEHMSLYRFINQIDWMIASQVKVNSIDFLCSPERVIGYLSGITEKRSAKYFKFTKDIKINFIYEDKAVV